MNVTSEGSDIELVDTSVKAEPIDWHEKPQDSCNVVSSTVPFEGELEEVFAEARSVLVGAKDGLEEGSSGWWNASPAHLKSAGASEGTAESLSLEASVGMPNSEDSLEAIYVKSEMAEGELEGIAVKEDPCNLHQQSQVHIPVTVGEASSTNNRMAPIKVRPKRPCPFCPLETVMLSRHITRCHSEKVSHMNSMSAKEKTVEFAKLRREGIYNRNMALVKDGESVTSLLRERKSNSLKYSDVVMCKDCLAFLSKPAFSRHRCISSIPVKKNYTEADTLVIEGKSDEECARIGEKYSSYIESNDDEESARISEKTCSNTDREDDEKSARISEKMCGSIDGNGDVKSDRISSKTCNEISRGDDESCRINERTAWNIGEVSKESCRINEKTSSEIGSTMKGEILISRLGKQYSRRFLNNEKTDEANSKTKTFMSQLTEIYVEFTKAATEQGKRVTIEAMFLPENMLILDDTLASMTAGNCSMMPTFVKTVERAAEILSCFYLIDRDKLKSQEVDDFLCLVKRMWANNI